MDTAVSSDVVALEVRGLTRRFGDFVAVDGLDLKVERGEVFGFLGPNGAGKTTTISMICGLLKPTTGEVRVHGKLVGEAAPELRRELGYCPQALVVWERLTCLEQLAFLGELQGLEAKQARERSLSLLGELGLGEKANHTARTLSGGMQRRLNIALALVHDPSIVVLDEPEAGLDPQSRALVRDFIRGMARRRTVIVTTHNMDEAERMADRVAVIDHGKLIALGSPLALREQHGSGGQPAPDLEYVFLALTGRRLRE